MQQRMSYGAHARSLMVVGLPLIGSNLAQMSLHVTDTVMLGWYGVEPLAAVVLGSSSFFILFIVGSGFAMAVMPMVAVALGREDETQVRRDTRMGLWLSLGFGVAIYPVMWWSGDLLLMLGQEPGTSQLAQDYMRIAGLGMVPALLVMTLKSYLSALERAGIVLWATLAALVLNAAINWALIFGNWGAPELGVKGAAIASLSTQLLTLAVLVFYAALLPELRRFTLFSRFWRPDWQALKQVFRLGWPIGLTSLAEGGLFQASALMMGWIGTVELAAHGIALQVISLVFMVHIGLSAAATVRVGRADGRSDSLGLRDGAMVATVIAFGVAILSAAVFVLIPGPLIALFLDEANESAATIVAYGSGLLLVAALFQVFDAMQVMALGCLRGLQDTQVPMWFAAFSYWIIGVPVSYALAFPLGFGGEGLWFGLVIGLACASALLTVRFWRRAVRAVPVGTI